MLIWSTDFHGTETWTLLKVDLKYLKSILNVMLKNERDQLDRLWEK
jgi:hypothetical protein